MDVLINHAIEQWHSSAGEGFAGFRVDVPPEGDLYSFILPIVSADMTTCFVLHDIARNQPLLDAMRDTGYRTKLALIEPFNEREKGMVSPQVMIDAINILKHDCDARKFEGRLVASGDSNLNDGALAFYRAIAPNIPSDVIIACHDYPKGTQDLYKAWHGTHDRDIEMFLDAIGNHDPACSEFGFHMYREIRTFLTSVLYDGSLTEQQVYDRLVEYLRRYARYNFLFAAVYQWGGSMTGDSHMEYWGLHNPDLSPKYQLHAITDYKEAA